MTPVMTADEATPRLPQTPLMPTCAAQFVGVGDQHRGADRVVDRGEQSDREQRHAQLQGRLNEADRGHGGANAQEEHRHHVTPAPAVAEPAGQQRPGAEHDERRAWRRAAGRRNGMFRAGPMTITAAANTSMA